MPGGGTFRTNQCPRSLVSHFSGLMLRWYPHYRNGHLPFDCALSEHPDKVIEAFSLIEDRIHHNELRQLKKGQRGKKSQR